MLAPPWRVGAPSSGKSWICHWSVINVNIKLDFLGTHLEALSLSLFIQYKLTLILVILNRCSTQKINPRIIPHNKNIWKTRMHSSRMRTARSSGRPGGVFTRHPRSRPSRTRHPPGTRYPLGPGTPLSRHPHWSRPPPDQSHPPVDRHTCNRTRNLILSFVWCRVLFLSSSSILSCYCGN